eukprot:SM000052S17764  [mRNA]  locus=s52:513531:516635:- [translate_table: standard]
MSDIASGGGAGDAAAAASEPRWELLESLCECREEFFLTTCDASGEDAAASGAAGAGNCGGWMTVSDLELLGTVGTSNDGSRADAAASADTMLRHQGLLRDDGRELVQECTDDSADQGSQGTKVAVHRWQHGCCQALDSDELQAPLGHLLRWEEHEQRFQVVSPPSVGWHRHHLPGQSGSEVRGQRAHSARLSKLAGGTTSQTAGCRKEDETWSVERVHGRAPSSTEVAQVQMEDQCQQELTLLGPGPSTTELTQRSQGTSTSSFRGVTRHRRTGKWEAHHLWEAGRQIYLGVAGLLPCNEKMSSIPAEGRATASTVLLQELSKSIHSVQAEGIVWSGDNSGVVIYLLQVGFKTRSRQLGVQLDAAKMTSVTKETVVQLLRGKARPVSKVSAAKDTHTRPMERRGLGRRDAGSSCSSSEQAGWRITTARPLIEEPIMQLEPHCKTRKTTFLRSDNPTSTVKRASAACGACWEDHATANSHARLAPLKDCFLRATMADIAARRQLLQSKTDK